jgi:DNA-binding response OmpR family regulator
MLPGLDGREVFRRLREDPLLVDVPVVFLSARSLEDGSGTLRPPGTTFVTKPFDPSELIETVRDALGDRP